MDPIDRAETIEIVLNGAPHQVPPQHTLMDLVAALALTWLLNRISAQRQAPLSA